MLYETNNISMIQKHTEINDDFLMFSTNIVNPGHYNVVGFYDDGKVRKESNKIHLTIHDQNIEKKNIYLDEKLLHTIAAANNGIYSKYYDVDNIINDINIVATYHNEKITKNILSYQYILFLLIYLLTFEWYIRNKIGLV